MKVLILSCNTGQGHNTAGKAVLAELQHLGIECEMLDALSFESELTSRMVSDIHSKGALHLPRVYGLGVSTAKRLDKISKKHSVCYVANVTYASALYEYITENGRDFLTRLGYREENGIYRILNPNEERVALFCHAGLMRAWMSVLLHIPIHTLWSSFSVTHTGITVFEFKNEPEGFTAPRCLAFSDTSHLYADGLDLKHCNKFEV